MAPTQRLGSSAALAAIIVSLAIIAQGQPINLPVISITPESLNTTPIDWAAAIYVFSKPFDAYPKIVGKFDVWMVDLKGSRIKLSPKNEKIKYLTTDKYIHFQKDFKTPSPDGDLVILVPEKNPDLMTLRNNDSDGLQWRLSQDRSWLQLINVADGGQAIPTGPKGGVAEPTPATSRESNSSTPETGSTSGSGKIQCEDATPSKVTIAPGSTSVKAGTTTTVKDPPPSLPIQEGVTDDRNALIVVLGMLGIFAAILYWVKKHPSRPVEETVDFSHYSSLQKTVAGVVGNQDLMKIINELPDDGKSIKIKFKLIRMGMQNKLDWLRALYELEGKRGDWGPYFSEMSKKLQTSGENLRSLAIERTRVPDREGAKDDVLDLISKRFAQIPVGEESSGYRRPILNIIFQDPKASVPATQIKIKARLQPAITHKGSIPLNPNEEETKKSLEEAKAIEAELSELRKQQIIKATEGADAEYSLDPVFAGLFRLPEFWEIKALRDQARRLPQSGQVGTAAQEPDSVFSNASPTPPAPPPRSPTPSAAGLGSDETAKLIGQLNEVVQKFLGAPARDPIRPRIVFNLAPLDPPASARPPVPPNQPSNLPPPPPPVPKGRGTAAQTAAETDYPPALELGADFQPDPETVETNALGPAIGAGTGAARSQTSATVISPTEKISRLTKTNQEIIEHLETYYNDPEDCRSARRCIEEAKAALESKLGASGNDLDPYQAVKDYVNDCFKVSPHEEDLERIMGPFMNTFNITAIKAADFGKPPPRDAVEYKHYGTGDAAKLTIKSAIRNQDDHPESSLRWDDAVKTVSPSIEFSKGNKQEMIVIQFGRLDELKKAFSSR